MRGSVAGIVLTGGASRRMGVEKTSLLVGGEPCVTRIERSLRAVTAPCLEVGPGRTSLPFLLEPGRGEGPLAAIAAGGKELRMLGHDGPTIVVAGDLPLVTEELLRWLVDQPGVGSVVPEVGGRRQPLLARWSRWDLESAVHSVASGRRALGDRPDGEGALTARYSSWSEVATPEQFSDIDTPEDLLRLGFHSEHAMIVAQIESRTQCRA